MPKLVKILTVMSLALCAGQWARSAKLRPDLHDPDTTMQAARAAEQSGDLARVQNKLQAALIDYQKAVRLDTRNSDLYIKLGVVQLKLDLRGPARKSFNQALKYNPQNSIALNNLGALAILDRRFKPAVSYLKQALALDETRASAHLNMAEAWLGLNQIDRAMTEYSRALELDPDILASSEDGVMAQVKTPEQRARIDFLVAKAYAKRGNADGALDFLQRAKDLHYPEMSKVYSDQEFAVLWKDPRLAKIVKR